MVDIQTLTNEICNIYIWEICNIYIWVGLGCRLFIKGLIKSILVSFL
jgi:hypothetical protein